jgi:hypothetical protein
MSDVERTVLTRTSFWLSLPSENDFIAIVLAVFLMLHVLDGTMLQRPAPDGASTPEEPRASSYD